MTYFPNEDAGGNFTPPMRIEARAGGNARVYMAGRDLHVTPEAPTAPAPVTALRTLPRDVVEFTGRQAEVDQLLAAAQLAQVVSIHTVDGMPGVGKTALVVHVARQLTDRFPDGQLFVRLQAHTPGQHPADPAETLAALLLGIGVDPRNIPDGLEARVGLWRDRLAGKRMLLVLDDAAGRAQVEPLLPGSGGCLVMVTSRRRIAALDGATPLALDTLPPNDATVLFTRLAHRPITTAADTDAVVRIVRLCGYLPLAIALLAGRLAHRPHWSLAQFADDFAATSDRLSELAVDDRAVAAAFDTSYSGLPTARQRLFRRLGLHPGTDADAYATAAIADISLAQARQELEALYDDHLIDSPAAGRYRLHDLLRVYAHDLAAGDCAVERKQALRRLLDYYQHTAERADVQLARSPRRADTVPVATPTAAPDLPDRYRAQAWMIMERANLFACIDHATAQDHHACIVGLTAAIAAYLRNDGPWAQAITLHVAAVTAARHVGDQAGLAGALHELGAVRRLAGDYPGAVVVLEQALDIYCTVGNQLGQANVVCQLGAVRWLTGDYPGAAVVLEQALDIYRIVGNQLGQANTLNYLGGVRRLTGDYPGATVVLEQALAAYRSIGDRNGQAHALNYLGAVRIATGDYSGATVVLEQALAAYRDTGDRLGHAHALHGVGVVRIATGDHAGATVVLEEVLDVYRDIGDRNGHANALNHMAAVQVATGSYTSAAVVLEQVHDAYRYIGDRAGETEVLNRVGALRLICGDPGQAQAHYERALELARTIHNQLEEARALEGVARCCELTSSYPAALSSLREAVSLYQRIGAAEAPAAAQYLAQLEATYDIDG
ncbi:tetratricopeptide repeat protein [Streptomyces sp. NPDC048106]|uniref:ATP-binding protein n=1 Tax=Streptomyces sp. NPDC048106 TaxID=3155750 RepID=UPI003453B98A